MADDIRKTGIQSWRQLVQQNQKPYNSENTVSEDWYREFRRRGQNSYADAPKKPVGIAAAQAGYGDSQYDDTIISESQFQDINDIRYENQPWYDVLGNGFGKMLGKATTTFVSSLVGLPYGIGSVITSGGDFSKLWDNSVTQGLSEVDNWFEKNLQNYQSTAQQQDPHFRLGDLNWWADTVIANAGFTIGAAASMAVGGGALGLLGRSFNLVNTASKATKGTAAFLSALFSATGEGMVEAKQGVEERNKLEFKRVDDELQPEKDALELESNRINQEYAANRGRFLTMGADGNAYDPAYEKYKQEMQALQERRDALKAKEDAAKQQIVEEGKRMGNMILAGNQVLLTLGNLIQFGKGITKSFDSARHAAETAAKTAKPVGVGVAKTAEGYKIYGKNFGKGLAYTKNILTEGSEEMNQQWIQSTAEAYNGRKNPDDYWHLKLNQEGFEDTVEGTYTFGEAISKGFKDSWGTKDQWEQFLVGAMMGGTGIYSPTKIFNQDKTKSRWDPRRYGSWEGGVINDVKDFNDAYRKYSENVDDLNRVINSQEFSARLQNFIAHTQLEKEKTKKAEEGDKKGWKDADDKQFIHDVQAFLRVGKLDDLRAMYNETAKNLSDEVIERIVKDTTKEISDAEAKQQTNDEYQKVIDDLNEKYKELHGRKNSLIGIIHDPDSSAEDIEAAETAFDAINDQMVDIDKQIDKLIQEKEEAVGNTTKRFEGSYVDSKGNRIKTNDEIRDIISHNTGELNRKLNSYLDSINFVNERTNGILSKDQEDHLAYLHNMGKSSIDRLQKIMGRVRKQMPKKFLLKTDKTVEELIQEYASSDLSFEKTERTKDGYVEVDTSRMNDAAFADFFQREILRGGNINPFFAETAEERANRESQEKKKKSKEQKKEFNLEQDKKDAQEQWETNWQNIVDNLQKNFKLDSASSFAESIAAFSALAEDIKDSAELYNQAGEFWRTLNEYMRNPELSNKAKEKEEEEITEEQKKKTFKDTFKDKDVKDIKRENAEGKINLDDFDEFTNIDLGDDIDEELQKEAEKLKKAKQGNRKASALKNSIQEQLGDAPTQKELTAAQMAMDMIDNANLNTDNPEDLNISSEHLQVGMDQIPPNLTLEDLNALQEQANKMIADAFNDYEEANNALDDIPDVKTGAVRIDNEPETGHDPVTKAPETPISPTNPTEDNKETVPKSPLKKEASSTAEEAVNRAVNTNYNAKNSWRTTTTRHPHGSSEGTYHENVAKSRFGENSIEYKRSKAIWEYLNAEGAFNRQENVDNDRIRGEEMDGADADTVHFMVKNLAEEIFGKSYSELSEKEKPYALAIILLNNKGEVIGDLPLVQLEPSFKSGNPTQMIKELTELQNKIFSEYDSKASTISKDAIVDSSLTKTGIDNLNMTFEGTDTPLVSKVNQVMRGAVPFIKGEYNTLNDVAGDELEIVIKGKNNAVYESTNDDGDRPDIIIPSVGSPGQSYMLLKTPSGEKIAIPFYTEAFDADKHQNTQLYKILWNSIYNLLIPAGTEEENKKNFSRHFGALKGLLQVTKQEGKPVIEKKGNTYTLHLQSITDSNQKIDISVPKTANPNADAINILSQLSGTPINISINYINSKISVGNKVVTELEYNKVIGEIADVNLPKNTTHTVNGWFTVHPVSKAKVEVGDKLGPKTSGRFTETIGGRRVEIDADRLVAIDLEEQEEIKGDEEINLRLAEIRANQPMNRGKDRIQVSIDGKVRTYDVKNKKFVENEVPKKITPESVHEHIQIANTYNGWNIIFPYAEWSKSILDIRNSEDGWGSVDGLIYYKKTFPGGRGNDNVTIWFKDSPSEAIAKQIELFIEKGKRLDDRETLAKILNGEKVFSEEENPDLSDTDIPLEARKKGVVRLEDKDEGTPPVTPQHGKNLEQIEEEMKSNKVLNPQTADAWNAIPESLKLKIGNGGASFILKANRKEIKVDSNDAAQFAKALKEANSAAKRGKLSIDELPDEGKNRVVNDEKQKRANIAREKAWLQKNLPMFNSEDRLKLIQGLIRIPGAEGWAWGRFEKGIITLSDSAARGTLYHEAFHAVTQTLLSDEDLDALYEAAIKHYGEEDAALVEELLAEDFRKYVQRGETPIIGPILKFFRKIMNAIRNITGYKAPIQNLFYQINNGKFQETIPRERSGGNAFYRHYTNRINDELFYTDDIIVREVIRSFSNHRGLIGDRYTTGTKWTEFKNYWKSRGVAVKGRWRYRSTGIQGYALDDVQLIVNGKKKTSKPNTRKYTEKRIRRVEEYGARQARDGRRELINWDRLTPEQQMNLMDSGMSEESYTNMSLEEQEQWLHCRS